jgi:hypothetical protein
MIAIKAFRFVFITVLPRLSSGSGRLYVMRTLFVDSYQFACFLIPPLSSIHTIRIVLYFQQKKYCVPLNT